MSLSNGQLNSQISSNLPRHVAIIMDGNGRWAKSRGLPRVEGHRQGAHTVRTIVEESRRLGIRYLTLFAFSTENWSRPQIEVGALMQLFKLYLEKEIPVLTKNGVRLRVIGDRERLPKDVLTAVLNAEQQSSSCSGLDLILAVSYGARDEIVRACRQIAIQVRDGRMQPAQIDESLVAAHMYAPEIPDPDLLIRTSDESRISNFLLWQLAYAEIVVSRLLWPEFGVDEYKRCLNEYGTRVRRFGLTDEQLNVSNN